MSIFVSDAEWSRNRAVEMFVAAAQAMISPSTEKRAAALIFGARALMLVADGDRNQRALELAETTIRQLVAERETQP